MALTGAVRPSHAIVVCLLAVLAPAGWAVHAQERLDVRLVGHRGFARDVPENSMAALEAAVALGLGGAEIDLRTTVDGHVVLMHDETVDRTTTGTGRVAGMTREALRRLRLEGPAGPTGEGVPDLDMVLAFLLRHPGFGVTFDAKMIDVASVGRQVLRAGVEDRVTFFVDDLADVELARAVKRLDPRLRLTINLRSWWQIEGLASFAQAALDADGLFAHEFYFPRFGFQEAARTPAEIQVYVPGEENLVERVRRAVALGAGVVSSDRPDLLVPIVARSP